jgi:hypothetical protein
VCADGSGYGRGGGHRCIGVERVLEFVVVVVVVVVVEVVIC